VKPEEGARFALLAVIKISSFYHTPNPHFNSRRSPPTLNGGDAGRTNFQMAVVFDRSAAIRDESSTGGLAAHARAAW
jgi:hypothetical protein